MSKVQNSSHLLTIPDMDPLLVEVKWQNGDDVNTKTVIGRRGEPYQESIPSGSADLTVRTILGMEGTLFRQKRSKILFLVPSGSSSFVYALERRLTALQEVCKKFLDLPELHWEVIDRALTVQNLLKKCQEADQIVGVLQTKETGVGWNSMVLFALHRLKCLEIGFVLLVDELNSSMFPEATHWTQEDFFAELAGCEQMSKESVQGVMGKYFHPSVPPFHVALVPAWLRQPLHGFVWEPDWVPASLTRLQDQRRGSVAENIWVWDGAWLGQIAPTLQGTRPGWFLNELTDDMTNSGQSQSVSRWNAFSSQFLEATGKGWQNQSSEMGGTKLLKSQALWVCHRRAAELFPIEGKEIFSIVLYATNDY